MKIPKANGLINTAKVQNVCLQGMTLGTRFLFIFFLAKYLDPASVGYYGLFTAAVGYAMYFVGMDFYTYVTRELIKAPVEQRGRLLKSQVALSGVLYLLLWPFAILFLYQSDWPGHLVWWFFPILLLEHFNQEMSRFLVAMSEQLTASVILFVRQGSWAVVIVVLMTWNESSRHLDVVMTSWAIAGVSAAIIGLFKLRSLGMGGWLDEVDWGWIKNGVQVSLAFLIATLALRGMQTIDRYWLEALGGIEIVGAYVILLGVASTLLAFLDAGIFAFGYPILIRLTQQKDSVAINAKVRQMFFQVLGFSAAFALGSWLVLPYLIDWIDNPIYRSAQHWYPWLLMAMVVNAISMVPHYGLYARGQDRAIIFSHVGALFVFVLTVLVFSGSQSILAVPLGLNLAFLFILFWKSIAYWFWRPESIDSYPEVTSQNTRAKTYPSNTSKASIPL